MANPDFSPGNLLARFLGLFCVAVGLFVGVSARAEIPVLASTSIESLLGTRTGHLVVHAWPGRFPIYIFDFPSLSEQGLTFNRVGALTERMHHRDAHILGDADLAAFIRSRGKTPQTFAYGNDFLVSELVVFLNLADRGGISLNREERRLIGFLRDRGLIREHFGFWQAVQPNAVILSIPQESFGNNDNPPVNALARHTILTHELAHAEYYTNAQYRDWCRRFWLEILDERQRQAFRNFLTRAGYDPGQEDLMINETQAYLSFTPDPRAFNAGMVGLNEAELERLRQAFRAGAPSWPIN